MFVCPGCSQGLERVKNPEGYFWICPSCRGRAATLPFLRQTLVKDYVNQIWQYAREGKGVRRRPCPACRDLMIDVPIVHGETAQWLDVCPRCQFVWFDAREYEESPSVGGAAAPADGGAPVTAEARQAAAIEEVRQRAEQARRESGGEGIDEWWKVLPAILGLPVEEEVPPVRRTPWLTWGLAGAVALVSVAAFFNVERAIRLFGLIPAQGGRLGGATYLTSFFLHAGFLHLAGNLYFLLIFGDNVEDFLGRWRFALLLLAATLAGGILHVAGDPRSAVPCVGASGGISGVIAFYALRFPHARLGIYWRYWSRFRRIQMSAWGAFVLWILLQGLIAWAQVHGHVGVSGMAHLGGAAAGVLGWAVWRKADAAGAPPAAGEKA